MSNDELEMDSRPARRPSRLWQRTDEIARRLREGYSYAQIARALSRTGHPVSARWLRRWCRANLGPVYRLHSTVTQASVPAGIPPLGPARTEAPERPPRESKKPAGSPALAEAYGPEPGDLISDLLKGTQR